MCSSIVYMVRRKRIHPIIHLFEQSPPPPSPSLTHPPPLSLSTSSSLTPHSLHPDLLALRGKCFVLFSQLQSTLKGVTQHHELAACEVIYVTLHHLLDLCEYGCLCIDTCLYLPLFIPLPSLPCTYSPHLLTIPFCSPLSSSLPLSPYNFFFHPLLPSIPLTPFPPLHTSFPSLPLFHFCYCLSPSIPLPVSLTYLLCRPVKVEHAHRVVHSSLVQCPNFVKLFLFLLKLLQHPIQL